MRVEDLKWSNIDRLEQHHITYILYREGKSINVIAAIRNIPKTEIEKQIIRCKLEFNIDENESDILINVISMNKEERVKYLTRIGSEDKEQIINEIIRRYASFKNSEDKSIIIWLIGELKDYRLLPYLRMELKSNRANQRRLACSALGKMKVKESKKWLEDMINDKHPQVRQYAVKALGHIGDMITVKKLESMLKKKSEKEYVIRAVLESIESIKKNILV